MLVALVLGVALAQGAANPPIELVSFAGEPSIEVTLPLERPAQPKLSPKNQWQFPWEVQGLGRPSAEAPYSLRIRTFSQERRTNDVARSAARMGMRLWDFNFHKLKLDHSVIYGNRVIDVYLCIGGTPGGEQAFAADPQEGKLALANTIYIYDIDSFTNSLERARELAHEYGHATLPPVGGFSQPEDWADGYLGEKLYLRWLRDEMRAKRLTSEDAMGVDLASLQDWVTRNTDALSMAAAVRGPAGRPILASKGQRAMDAFMGMVLLADDVLPTRAFARSLKLIGSTSAKDYPDALKLAVEEAAPCKLRIPSAWIGRPVWVPLGSCRLPGTKILARQAGWARMQPRGPSVSVSP